MQQYLDLMQHVKTQGVKKEDRTGTGTLSVYCYPMRFSVQDLFRAITSTPLHCKSIIHEWLWFLNGETNIQYLQDNGGSIWDEWADDNGDLGPVYGAQWRTWKTIEGKTIDQI